ncbi:MAG: TonB-dependent receptor, partial [Pseudomonadota bacterium]
GRIPTFLSVPNLGGATDPLAFTPIPGNSNDNAGDGTYNVSFEEVTGRIGLDWQPDLAMTEDTLLYAFYSRGYKGGGINPPQPAGASFFPQTFDPEFINSYEIGTKNTLANGALQLNATGFLYEYEGYQITQIINRTSANFNVDAEINGFELETVWNPVSTLVLNANLGLMDAKIVDTFGVDVLDRTNGRDDLVVLKLFPGAANCVVSAEGYATVLGAVAAGVDGFDPGATLGLCTGAFAGAEAALGVGDVTFTDSDGNVQTVGGLTPFEGDAVNLDGNRLPGTPESTFSFGAEYTWEAPGGDGTFADWSMTARADYYYQDDSFSRVWNTTRDQLESWDNVNLSLRFDNVENGLAVEIFGKNVTNEQVITGAYLTDDSSGLFTNVFLTEPSTWGVSLSKSW